MMQHFKVTMRTDLKQMRKDLKKDGWVSAHYLTRHGWNVDDLRKKAKKNEIESLQVNNYGSTTWYYKEKELNEAVRPKRAK